MIKTTDKILYVDIEKRKFHLREVQSEKILVPVSIPLTSYIFDQSNPESGPNLDFIVIGIGLLGGRSGVGLSVATISGISPQSNGLIEAKVEGKLAASLRSLDLDAIAVVGTFAELSGLHITKKFQTSRNSNHSANWDPALLQSRNRC